MRWMPCLAVMLLAGVVATVSAGDGDSDKSSKPVPVGDPVRSAVVQDREFGVRTAQFGLDRQVEMYQWYRNGDRYEQVWKPALVDSAGFAPGHGNPSAFPLESLRWWASDVRLDGKPVDLSVLKALGKWQDFRPGFSRLPTNLAATFQPEGDGLGSAINPLDPQVGDLRIHWRELHLPALAGRVELRDGRWQLSARTEKAAINARPLPPVAPVARAGDRRSRPWAIGVGLTVLVVIGLLLVGRRRRKHLGKV